MRVDQNETRTRLTFLLLVGLVLAIVFLVSSVERISRLVSLNASVVEMEQSIEWAKQRKAELLDELRYIASPVYVDAVARGELGYSRPGDEVIIVLKEPGETETAAQRQPARSLLSAQQAGEDFFLLDVDWWSAVLGQEDRQSPLP